MSNKYGVQLLPPYAFTFEKREETNRSMNDLRFNLPNWYSRRKILEVLNDDVLGSPQEIPPSMHLWKTMGIPPTCSEPFKSHIAFNDIFGKNDRKRKEKDFDRFVLTDNTRYGLEEVYHRLYGARKELNPFAQREQTAAAVRHKMLNQKNEDYLNARRKQLLAEADARNYKSSAPFHVQRDSAYVTQAGDFDFKVPLSSLRTNEFSLLPAVSDTRSSLNPESTQKFQNDIKKLQPGSETYERDSILEAKDVISRKQKEIRNVIISADEMNVKSGNDERLRKLYEHENKFDRMKDVEYQTTPTEEYMKQIGVGPGSFPVKTSRETLVCPPDYARVILSQEKDNSALNPAPLYHSMVWKTQLIRDFNAIYPDPLPEEHLCANIHDSLLTKMKFGHYRHLDITDLKAKLILK